jgi:short subunit dehydrogenase-like uncharacterized protein
MKIAVNGASGYTGRLVVAELTRQGIQQVLVGRDAERLRAVADSAGAADADQRLADVNDPAALAAAFQDCDAVVNCAGPFRTLGEPVVRAALAAGCHYVDTAGEQHHIKRTFEVFARSAQQAGLTVVPGMAEDGGASDLLAHLLGAPIQPVETLTIAVDYRDGQLSRGSLRSALTLAGDGEPDDTDGASRSAAPARRQAMTFPGRAEPVALAELALPGVVTVPRHLRVRRVEGLANRDLVTALGSVNAELVEQAPEGPDPDTRQAHRWIIVVEAVASDGAVARGVVEGRDPYGTTAVIAVEAARRLLTDGARAGVLAPAQAYDPAGLLDFLAPHGVRWTVQSHTAPTG